MKVPGNDEIRELTHCLKEAFGDELILVGPFGPEIDSIGWRIKSKPHYLFSVSTHAGKLSVNFLDYQSSIADYSLENGEITDGLYDYKSINEIIISVREHIDGLFNFFKN